MKLTIEQYGYRYSIETPHDDVDTNEIQHLLKQLLMCAGFHPEGVNEIFKEE